jgi:hypothetical protein
MVETEYQVVAVAVVAVDQFLVWVMDQVALEVRVL